MTNTMKWRRHRGEAGFSLVELMAAVALVSTLVALALPRYRLFITSARQAEAHANLGIIASLQQTYQLASGVYCCSPHFYMGQGVARGGCGSGANKEENFLGFRVVACDDLRYTYEDTRTGGEATHDETGSADPIYPGCTAGSYKDYWSIMGTRELYQIDDIVGDCHD